MHLLCATTLLDNNRTYRRVGAAAATSGHDLSLSREPHTVSIDGGTSIKNEIMIYITNMPHQPSNMPLSKQQKVIKRDGRTEPISFDKIIWRIQSLASDLNGVDIIDIVKEVISDIYDGISTASLDDIAARQCANRSSEHPDYDTLAGRIVISSHHKDMNIRGLHKFSDVTRRLYENKDEEGLPCPLLRKDKYEFIMRNISSLENMIDYEYDYKFSFFL